MTLQDSDLNVFLAWSIGYDDTQVRVVGSGVVQVRHSQGNIDIWRDFDFRDPSVIWPIAKKFDAFPYRRAGGGWLSVCLLEDTKGRSAVDYRPEAAVALAVVGAHRG